MNVKRFVDMRNIAIAKEFVKERNAAIVKAVVEDDWTLVDEYLNKYNIKVPDNPKAKKAGIFKACCECADIPFETKMIAANWLMDNGFNVGIRS